MPRLLIVDDEIKNINIILEHLDTAGRNFEVETANDGETAISMLKNNEEKYDLVLLDRMMPGVDGIQVLQFIKLHPALNKIPVIMQTARSEKHEILEGLAAGASYYLTKPYDEDMLLNVIDTALRDYLEYKDLRSQIKKQQKAILLLENGRFVFRTIEEARLLATTLAAACGNPDKVVTGLSELFINAVEHGNLGIGYDEKSKLNETGTWDEEIERRQTLEENKNKTVKVDYKKTSSEIEFTITDEGSGFDWKQYLELSVDRIYDNHGRGIFMANKLSFEKMTFIGTGNSVKVIAGV